MSWFSISDHNKKAFRLILVGLVLWPTPLPGFALLLIPGLLLLDCSLKRKVDKFVWNTSTGSFLHAKILKLFMAFESQLPFLKKKFKKQRTAYRKWKIGRWLFPRIMLMFSGTIEEFASYRAMFIALKERAVEKGHATIQSDHSKKNTSDEKENALTTGNSKG